MQYNQTNLSQKPKVISPKRTSSDLPIIGSPDPQSTSIQLKDYVNAFVMNEVGEALVLEGMRNGRSWSSWQLIGRSLVEDEDPMLAVQEDLLLRTGYTCTKLIYLGTFIIDESQTEGAGHFFCAQLGQQVTAPDIKYTGNYKPKWVTKRILKQALLDGRIAVINHVVAASLAMVMCDVIK
jgi:hypothetical protein